MNNEKWFCGKCGANPFWIESGLKEAYCYKCGRKMRR